MKQIIIKEPGVALVENVNKPERKSGEVLLKLLYGGICGSDLGTYRGSNAYTKYPCIPGHEFSARVEEVDDNDLGISVGQIVTCNPYFNCGTCYSCDHGVVNACMDNQTMGVQRSGGFSEYLTMPIERVYDGQGIDPKSLALVEPFCISYHGVKRANVGKGDRVLVIGAGGIGVLAAVAAKYKGAEVYISDIAQDKLDYAMKFGLDGVILNSSPEAFAKQVEEITQGNGFDVCIEAVGMPQTFQSCIDSAAFGGRVVLIGISKNNLDFNFTMIQKKELNVYGSRNALKEDFEEVIEIVKSGKVDLTMIITNQYSYEQAGEAFEHFAKNAGSTLKVLLSFE